MKKILLFSILIIGLASNMAAQNLLSFSGGFATSGEGSLSWSLGEMAVATYTSPTSGFLTQGFQQPDKGSLVPPDTINTYIQNYGLTVNGDGANDYLIIDGITQHPSNELYVFSRWGNQVYYKKDYNNKDELWDGKQNGQPLPQGTYYYVLKLVKVNKTYRGCIYILTN